MENIYIDSIGHRVINKCVVVGGMEITGETELLKGTPIQYHFFHHKS
jgi:hypothetical protein